MFEHSTFFLKRHTQHTLIERIGHRPKPHEQEKYAFCFKRKTQSVHFIQTKKEK